MGDPEEIKDRIARLHPSIFGELAYSVKRFLFVLSKENFYTTNFLFKDRNPFINTYNHTSKNYSESPWKNETTRQVHH